MDYYDPMLRFTRIHLVIVLACALSANAQSLPAKARVPISSELDGDLFYQLLLGEIKARGGDPDGGYSMMLDAARKTKNAKLFQRAVEIALQARQGDQALQAARAWRQILPNSVEANSFIFQILIGLNRIGETLEPLKRELALTAPRDRAAVIAAVPRYYMRASDKLLAATTVEQALAGYLTEPDVAVAAWTTIGRMRFEAGQSDSAIDAAGKAQDLDVSAEGPALLALLMMNAKVAKAEALVTRYLAASPKPEVRMAYIRSLLGAQRYAEAQTELLVITAQHPDFADAWLIQGVLQVQEKNLDPAEQSLKHYLTLVTPKNGAATESPPGLTQAYLSLAQIAEQREDHAAADAWLNRIDRADDVLNAQLRRAMLLARQGQIEQARSVIHSQPERSPAEARLKISAEVQILRDSKQYAEAYKVLTQATSHNPSDLDFFYDTAMVVEKMGNLAEMERLLRAIIAVNPEYHHAYNALGYSLAERGIRLPEARQLILKALEFAKDDPFISDSLGWVEFRSGNLEEALRILRVAFKTKPDAEIAAHLGEVLWAMGQHDEAIVVWKEGLALNNDNETLLETLKRLRVKW